MKTETASSIFKCPVCGECLFCKNSKQYCCSNNHSYDVAREGYINLVYPASKTRAQGDNKEMVSARRNFLTKGYYQPLADLLIELCSGTTSASSLVIVDSACGEGYYLKSLIESKQLNDKSPLSCYGFDLSKSAVKSAAKTIAKAKLAVANVFKLPLLDHSADLAYSIFAPQNEAEIHRILKKSGIWVVVSPGPNHLFELKQKLYDEVALNDHPAVASNFIAVKKSDLKYAITINKEDLKNLVMMTPYYWKTDRSRIDHLLNESPGLTTRVAFTISVFQPM